MCYAPIQIYQPYAKRYVTVPCGHCIACARRRRRNISIRLVEEFKDKKNLDFYMVTLTYNEENLPWATWSPKENKEITAPVLNRRDMQLFLKRLRKYYKEYYGLEFRIFYCGEYGKTLSRPHFHAIIFSPRVINREELRRKISELWGYGYIVCKRCDSGAAWYVSKYVVDSTLESLRWQNYPRGFRPFCQSPRYLGMSYISDVLIKQMKDHVKNNEYDKIGYTLVKNGKACICAFPPTFFDAIFSKVEKAAIISNAVERCRKATQERISRYRVAMLQDIASAAPGRVGIDWPEMDKLLLTEHAERFAKINEGESWLRNNLKSTKL